MMARYKFELFALIAVPMTLEVDARSVDLGKAYLTARIREASPETLMVRHGGSHYGMDITGVRKVDPLAGHRPPGAKAPKLTLANPPAYARSGTQRGILGKHMVV